MNLKCGGKYILLSESWDEIKEYKIEKFEENKVCLRYFDDYINEGPVKTIVREDVNKELFKSPYSLMVEEVDRSWRVSADFISDLSSSWIREKPKFPVDELINKLLSDWRLKKMPRDFVEYCLRSLVASGFLVVSSDGRRKAKFFELSLSDSALKFERARIFAGSMAGELDSMSQRVRNLISHAGAVGTYRENLLQTLLRKNLPERYHVATGFIENCPRQLDILIYDRLEYAPLFREGDLVVVPQESVRAVIEVKTTLNGKILKESLQLLDEVAVFDDLKPPFFRGIFAFESSISAHVFYENIIDFYAKEPIGIEDMLEGSPIMEPFRHVSAVCVMNLAYAYAKYQKLNDKYIPLLIKGESVTGLRSQAALFIQELLVYLRFGGLKPVAIDYIPRGLGADTAYSVVNKLVGNDLWGSYFAVEDMGADDKEVEDLEKAIADVDQWRETGAWGSGSYESL